MFVVILLMLSIETNNALTAKSYQIEANKAGSASAIETDWEYMKSQGVSFSECYYECSKNDKCLGFAYKPPSGNEAYENNCNILNGIAPTDIVESEGWTLYKCECCATNDCESKEFWKLPIEYSNIRSKTFSNGSKVEIEFVSIYPYKNFQQY